jgi:hypothetical protein
MKNIHTRKEGGQTLLIIVLLFAVTSTTAVFGMVSPLVRQAEMVRSIEHSKKSYFTAEAASEDAYYRFKNNVPVAFPHTLLLDGARADVTLSVIGAGEQEIFSRGDSLGIIRNTVKEIGVTNGFSFNFAVQVGNGGAHLQNGSSVIGNIYSSGEIRGYNTSPNSYNFINGSAVSTGGSGRIDQVRTAASAYANRITNSTIGTDAYYQTISNTTVGGVSYPNSRDQNPIAFPIPDSLIDQWKSQAEQGGVINSPCPYTINESATIGTTKINCDVIISGNKTELTLTGPIWIKGDLTIQNSVVVKVADAIGNRSIPLVVDDPDAALTKGVITLKNSTSFFGATNHPDSYVLLVSQNRSAENGGANSAILVENGATGNLLVYASHGEIKLQNNVGLREVTAYKLTLQNNAQVVYSIGLAQPLFPTGPGGTWKIKRWRESK